MNATMILEIPSRGQFPVSDLADASRTYARLRTASGEGGSTFKDGVVSESGIVVGHISYNARVWAEASRYWKPGDKPILEAQG